MQSGIRIYDLPTAVRFATSFALGHDDDEDQRPWVLVCRQYGSRAYPIPPWAVYVVTWKDGVDAESRVKFDDQHTALDHGFALLAALRR